MAKRTVAKATKAKSVPKKRPVLSFEQRMDCAGEWEAPLRLNFSEAWILALTCQGLAHDSKGSEDGVRYAQSAEKTMRVYAALGGYPSDFDEQLELKATKKKNGAAAA